MTVSPCIPHRAGGTQQEGGNVNMAWAHSCIGAAAASAGGCPSPPAPMGNSAVLSRNADGHTLMPDNRTKGFLN